MNSSRWKIWMAASVGDPRRAERVSLIALALGCLLLFNAWPDRHDTAAARCSEPSEIRARDGWTVAVRCAEEAPTVAHLRGPARLLFGRELDLNRADAAALEVLPGIGPSRASAIVAARIQRPFDTVSELQRVHGIGPKTVAGLRGWVTVERAP